MVILFPGTFTPEGKNDVELSLPKAKNDMELSLVQKLLLKHKAYRHRPLLDCIASSHIVSWDRTSFLYIQTFEVCTRSLHRRSLSL